METSGQLLLVMLAWALGTLTPVIAERIRRDHRTPELRRAITAELKELQFKMVAIVYYLRADSGTITIEFLKWRKSIVSAYDGPEPTETILKMASALLDASEPDRQKFLEQQTGRGLNTALVSYELPLVTAYLSELSTFPVDFQIEVLRIKGQLEMFNQRVVLVDRLRDKTFDSSLSQENRGIIRQALEKHQADQTMRAEQIAQLISKLPAVRGFFSRLRGSTRSD